LGIGILAGTAINLFIPGEAKRFLDENILRFAGTGFIRLVQFVVIPLVFTALVIGMSNILDIRKVGKYSVKLLTLYLATGFISLGLGLLVGFLLKPGRGVHMAYQEISAPEALTLTDWMLRVIPKNPFEAVTTGNMLQVIFSALLIGAGLTLAGEKGKPLLSFFDSVYEVIIKVVGLILKLAPVGVFALMASVIADQGLGILKNLSLYVAGMFLAALVMGGGVYSLLLALSGCKPMRFWKAFYPAFAFAFGTASSSASLPVAMDNAETRFGMKKDIIAFALPFGTSLKKDAAMLLQSLSALFVAQMAGIQLSSSQVLAIIISTVFVSFSTAGIPAGGLIMMSTVFTAAGLPLEGVVILAGVDRVTDTFRTALNVIGYTANAAILERWENRPPEKP